LAKSIVDRNRSRQSKNLSRKISGAAGGMVDGLLLLGAAWTCADPEAREMILEIRAFMRPFRPLRIARPIDAWNLS
jgi:hypothetical protein